MDSQGEGANGGRWMTYAEIAVLRRISKASAERLVRRHRWRRQADNRGYVRAYVPLDWCNPVPPTSPDVHPDIRRDGVLDITPVIAPLQAAIAALQQQLDHANRQADRAETRTEQAENRAILAESGCNAERSRADALRDRLEGLTAELADAQAELAAAHDRAEAASRGLGRWARLRRAWGGG